MTGSAENRLDRFVAGRAAQWLAFAWGFAEATFFFIVPDVLLTLLGLRAWRQAVTATLTALLGALLGGAVMYVAAVRAPDETRALLDFVPGINAGLIASVAARVDEQGLTAMMIGPLKGIPYKIYAADWGARGGSFFFFLLASIPARYVRFLLSVLLANLVARLLAPLTNRRANIELTILAVVWIAFYAFYFSRFGR